MEEDKNVAKYFESDLDYLKGFTKDLGFSQIDWDNVTEEVTSAILEDRQVESDMAKRVLTSFFVGDGEWNEPLGNWFIFPGNYMIDFVEYNWYHRFRELARRYGDLESVSVPVYSTPKNVKGRDKSYSVPFKALRYSDSRDCLVMTTSILSLEWTEYVMDEIGINYDSQLLDTTRKEVLMYYSEDKDLSEDSKRVLRSLKRNDDLWLENVKEEFDMNSFLLSFVEKSNKRFMRDL